MFIPLQIAGKILLWAGVVVLWILALNGSIDLYWKIRGTLRRH